MKSSLKKLERSVKTDRTCVLILAVILVLLAAGLIAGAVSLLSKEPADFALRTETAITGIEETSLYIGEERYHTIFTNIYALENDAGNTDYQAMAVIEQVRTIVRYSIMAVIMFLVYLLFRDCRKLRTPFTKKSVWLLRWIAILTMAVTILPELVCMIMSMAIFTYAIFEIPESSYYVMILGAVFGMIAEVFKYGAVLQEDSDSIA